MIERRKFLASAVGAAAAIPLMKADTILKLLQPAPRIFEMNDCDWILAHSQEEAANFYCEMVGARDYVELVAFEEGYPMEVCDEMLDKLRFHREALHSEGPHVVSFREELASQIASGEPIPHLFASTEY